MKKKVKVVMLPTEKAARSTILSNEIFGLKFGHDVTHEDVLNKDTIPNYLCLVSDEEIKDGDWCVIIDKESILYGQMEQHKGLHQRSDKWKKVIAITDKDLINDKESNLGKPLTLPQIPESFVKTFVEANGEIDEVMVEYEYGGTLKMRRGNEVHMVKVKTTDNNEVIIHLIEEKMYCREEVKRLMFKSYNLRTQDNKVRSTEEMNIWIEENL